MLKDILNSLFQSLRRLTLVLTLIPTIMLAGGVGSPRSLASLAAEDPIPVFAYYYIWYQESSWERAKIDYPLLGRYNSDDSQVMRQHIQWAKQVGIDGFIVSWKSTETLNTRLEQLMALAEQEDFKLVVIYQGLTFERQPRSLRQVELDFDYFASSYAPSPAFQVFSKPVIIWNGTWMYAEEQVQALTQPRRDKLYILAAEKSVEDYLRIADWVDGNAYYWSSLDPYVYPNFQKKLVEMGQAVHEHAGIWMPSAAPGFDARLVGGSRVIDRKEGETLRIQMNAAANASPDVIGLISWNEFSENTHIEPSEQYGRHYLDVLMDILGTPAPPPVVEYESSEPAISQFEMPESQPVAIDQDPGLIPSRMDAFLARLGVGKISALLFLPVLVFISLAILVVRRLNGQ